MTTAGICHNASFDETRLTVDMARELRPAWCRTIVYPWSWDLTIQNALELLDAGTKTLVVYNTESDNTVVDDLEGHAANLNAFLLRAGGMIAAVEPGNELDTPGWTDSHGQPISDQLIIAIGRMCAEVCRRHGVLCLSPSLLSGPGEGRFETIARGLAGHVEAMAVHPYYRSLGGFPRPGWIFGTVEDAADECERLGSGLPTWFTEAGCTTRFDSIGEDGQAAFTEALRHFQHPSIPVICQFALHDRVGGAGELAEGKDWGLTSEDGRRRPAWDAFAALATVDDVITPEPDPVLPEPEPVPMHTPDEEIAMNDIEAFIRDAAQRRGIDPDIAVKVANSEGSVTEPARRGTFATGSSWWPFQLHYGGTGYEQYGTTAGMGTGFTALTGWLPGDPDAWRDSVRYALNRVKGSGWGAWYGAAHVGIGQWDGIDRSARWDASAELWDYEGAVAEPSPLPAPEGPEWTLGGTSAADLKRKLDGLVTALAEVCDVEGDKLAAATVTKKRRLASVEKMRAIRQQFIGPRTAA